MISSVYDQETGILKVVLTGTIDNRKVIEYMHSFGSLKFAGEQLRILQDLSQAVLAIDIDTVNQISQIIKGHLKRYKSIRVASVFSDPKSTAYSMLIEHRTDFEGYEHKVFSSMDSAMEWISR